MQSEARPDQIRFALIVHSPKLAVSTNEVLAELQRELIVANTHDGLQAARARGKLTPQQATLAQQLYDTGGHWRAHPSRRSPTSSACPAPPSTATWTRAPSAADRA